MKKSQGQSLALFALFSVLAIIQFFYLEICNANCIGTKWDYQSFPGVLANDHINLDLQQGEILALLGENGAGKTTLMNILNGLYKPDEGEISIKGEKATIHSPNDSIARGIGMVHQHFMLIPVHDRNRECNARN